MEPEYTFETLNEWMLETYIPWFEEFGSAGRGLEGDEDSGNNGPPPPPPAP